MTGLEITLNGKKVSLASLNCEYGVITAIVTCTKRFGEKEETITVDIAGLDSQTRNRLEWFHKDLEDTDEIGIKILPSGESDIPSVITVEAMRQRSLNDKLKTFYRLREELKDHIES